MADISEILNKVTAHQGVSVDGPVPTGNFIVYTLRSPDRQGVKEFLEKELAAPTRRIPFNDGPQSTGSIRSVDFKIGGSQYRVKIKPAGGGSGAGSSTTAIGESLQCWALSARQAKKSALEDATEIWEHAKTSNVDATISLEDCKIASDEWMNSALIIANSLFKKELNSGTYIFERGGSLTGKIEAAYKKHKTAAGVTANINKWNPADIWVIASTKSTSIASDIKECTNLAELNNYIAKSYKSGALRGVSLKKVVSVDRLKKTVYNLDKDVVGKIKYTGIENHDMKHIGSNDIYILGTQNTKKFKIQFRRFSGFDHQGEIKGSTANGGKVGGGPYQGIVKKSITPKNWVDLKDKDDLFFTNFPSPKALPYFNANLKGAIGKTKLSTTEQAKLEKGIQDNFKTKGKVWWHSKFFGLQLARVIKEAPVDKRHKIVYDLFTYASSALPKISSAYLKVYE